MKPILTILLIVILWQVSNGQKTVSFPNITSIVDTSRMQLKAGHHKIIIRYSVNRKVTYDTINVQIWPDSARYHINQMPFANAGKDFIWPLGKTASITGGGYDPDGTISGWRWRKIKGPLYGKISYPTRKATTLTGLVAGTYSYELTVTDNNAGIAKDTINITSTRSSCGYTRTTQVVASSCRAGAPSSSASWRRAATRGTATTRRCLTVLSTSS